MEREGVSIHDTKRMEERSWLGSGLVLDSGANVLL